MPANNQWPSIKERLTALEVKVEQVIDPEHGLRADIAALGAKLDIVLEERAERRPLWAGAKLIVAGIVGALAYRLAGFVHIP